MSNWFHSPRDKTALINVLSINISGHSFRWPYIQHLHKENRLSLSSPTPLIYDYSPHITFLVILYVLADG